MAAQSITFTDGVGADIVEGRVINVGMGRSATVNRVTRDRHGDVWAHTDVGKLGYGPAEPVRFQDRPYDVMLAVNPAAWDLSASLIQESLDELNDECLLAAETEGPPDGPEPSTVADLLAQCLTALKTAGMDIHVGPAVENWLD